MGLESEKCVRKAGSKNDEKMSFFVKPQISYLSNIWRPWELQELENDEKTCQTAQKLTKIENLRFTKNEPENAAEHQKWWLFFKIFQPTLQSYGVPPVLDPAGISSGVTRRALLLE